MTSLVTPFHNAKESESFFTKEQLCQVIQAHSQFIASGQAVDYAIFFRPKFTSFVVVGIDEEGNQIDLRHITAKKCDSGGVKFSFSVHGYLGESMDFSEALNKFSKGIQNTVTKRPGLKIVN